TIWSILEDGAGQLWMSSNRGLFRAAKSDLNNFLEGNTKTIRYTSYGTKDGLPTSEFNGGYQTAATQSDGQMFFATVNGVLEFSPLSFVHNRLAPPVVIESALLNNHPLQPGK